MPTDLRHTHYMPATTTSATTLSFVTGETYMTRFIGDADSRLSFTVVSRTAKTVKIRHHSPINGREVTSHRPRVIDGEETISPLGSYSMAPMIRAGRTSL